MPRAPTSVASEASSSTKQPQPPAKKEGKLKLVTFSGCIICRARRKKCDERKPGCETCQRLSIECLGYSNKRPLYLQDKQNLEAVRAEITAFLSRSGRVRRHGKGDQAALASTAAAKGKGKAREEDELQPVEPEVLRFTFSLDTKDDVRAGKSARPSGSSRRVRQKTSAVTASPPTTATTRDQSSDNVESAEGSAEDAEGESDTAESPPSPFIRPLPPRSEDPHGSSSTHAASSRPPPYAFPAPPLGSFSESQYQTTPAMSPNTFYAPPAVHYPDAYFPIGDGSQQPHQPHQHLHQHQHQHQHQHHHHVQYPYHPPQPTASTSRTFAFSPPAQTHYPLHHSPTLSPSPSYAQDHPTAFFPPVEDLPRQTSGPSHYSHLASPWPNAPQPYPQLQPQPLLPHPPFHYPQPPTDWLDPPRPSSSVFPSILSAGTDFDLQQMGGPPSQQHQQRFQLPPQRPQQQQHSSRRQTLPARLNTGYEIVPQTLDSPLERMGLPQKEFGYIQYCVEMMDSMKGTARRPGSVTQQVYKIRPGRIALLDEPSEDPQAVVARMREVQAVQNMTYVAMRMSCWRDVMCSFASRHQALRRAAAAGRGRPREWTPPHVDSESQMYRDRAFESLMHSLSSNTIDAVSALFTALRMIWTEVIRGGVSGWYQPLLIARRCIERIVGERAVLGELGGDGRLGEVVMYLLKYTAWVDVLGCAVLAEETPLYALYTAVLSQPNSGIDMALISGFTSPLFLALLRTSYLATLLRRSQPPLNNPNLIPSLTHQIETSLASHPSLPSHLLNPDTPPLQILQQIHLHGVRLYFLSTLSLQHPHTYPNPSDPEIAQEVHALMHAVSLLPDPQLRRSCTFPLAMAGFLCGGGRERGGGERETLRRWLSGEEMGAEAAWVGNTRVVLWVMEAVWAERDRREEGAGDGDGEGESEGVDWLGVMRGLGVEVLLA